MAELNSTTNVSSYADRSRVPEDVQKLESVIRTVLCISCILAVVVNLKVFACIHWIRRPLNSVLKISLSLALADSCASCLSAVNIFVEHLISLRTFIVLDIIRLCFILVTVFHLLGLSFNHYIGIRKPLHHNSRLSQRGTSGLIFLLWLIPTTFAIALCTVEGGVSFWQAMISNSFSDNNNTPIYSNLMVEWNQSTFALNGSQLPENEWYLQTSEKHNDIEGENRFITSFRFRMIISSFVLVSMFLIVLCYLWILIMIRRQRKVWKDLSRTGSAVWKGHNCRHVTKQKSHEQNKTKGNLRAVYTTLIILGSCVMGWMPALLLYALTCREGCFISGELLKKLSENYPKHILMLRFFDNEMLFLKMIANPIIYSVRMREIKEGTKQMHHIILHHLCGGRCTSMHQTYSKSSSKSSNGNHSHVVLTSLGSIRGSKCGSGRYRRSHQCRQTSDL